MASRVNVALKMVSPNILIRPTAELTSTEGSKALLKGWSLFNARRRDTKETTEALYRLKQYVTGWSQAEFLNKQQTHYTALMEAVSNGDESALKGLVTPAVLAAIRLGIDQSIAETGSRQGAKVLRAVAPPVVTYGRAFHTKTGISAGSVDAAARPDWIQLAVTNVTLQLPTAARVTAEKHSASSGMPKGSAPSRSPLPAWRPVLSTTNGQTFWMDQLSGKVQWEQPLQSQIIAAHPSIPFRIESAGAEREPFSFDGQSVMKVTHRVVWERCTKEGAPDAWRICAL